MLIQSIDVLRQFTNAASGSIQLIDIKPSLLYAESQLAQNVIGPELLTEVNAAFTAGNLTPEQTLLLPHLQRYIATAAVLHFIPKSEVMVSSSGIFRMETDSGKTAYQQQVLRLTTNLQQELDLHHEAILHFLDSNAGSFATYTSSAAFAINRSLFIQNGLQFAATYYCAAPYRVYQRLRPILADVEALQLPKVLGDVFMAELKQKLAAPTPALTAQEKRLVDMLRKFTAFAAIAKGVAQQLLTWDERGLTVYAGEGRSDVSDDAKRASISPTHIDHFLNETKKSADDWLQELSFYLQSTSSTLVFASWYNWQQAIAATTASTVCDHTHTHTFSL